MVETVILWAQRPEEVRFITAAGGWCAPGEGVFILPGSLPERWPPGLLPEDIEWLARMLWLGGIDPDPYGLPAFTVPRGGIPWPVSSGVTEGD